MDSLCQLSQSTRLDRVLSLLEAYYRALGNPGLARRQLLHFCPDLIEIFCVDNSFVFAGGLVRRVQCSRVSQQRRIERTGLLVIVETDPCDCDDSRENLSFKIESADKPYSL